MIPRDCPKFDSCSAPLCPLDNTAGSHLDGEPVSFYLREYVKDGGRARLSTCLPGGMLNHIAEALPGIISQQSDIKRRLDKAALSGSKSVNLNNIRMEAA